MTEHGRLIDADALKEKAFGKRGGLLYTADIDEMPTIEEWKDCTTCRYNDYEWYNEPCDSCTGRHKHWRPARKTGKWILKDHLYECDNCGCRINRFPFKGNIWNYNFCPNCGASMRCSENPNS